MWSIDSVSTNRTMSTAIRSTACRAVRVGFDSPHCPNAAILGPAPKCVPGRTPGSPPPARRGRPRSIPSGIGRGLHDELAAAKKTHARARVSVPARELPRWDNGESRNRRAPLVRRSTESPPTWPVRRRRVDRPSDRPQRRQHRTAVSALRRPRALGYAQAATGRRRSRAAARELALCSGRHRGGHTYINFTPSLGGSLPAIAELARYHRALHAGKDGKTGETLMKTVLAPMFAHRNLKVMSWVGHNIFGNRDGLVLDDPSNKSSKVETKDRVVTQILGYKPSTIVTIEYLPDMGDWKTAWDHIHFQGFLGTKMTLQFTWQGCDSLLAAPLAIDLARLADLEKRRGGHGLMRHLASFFKSPEGVEEHDFFKQFDLLADYVRRERPPRSGSLRPAIIRAQ